MQTKYKLLFIVAVMLLALGIATTINVGLNFREYSINSAKEKAIMVAAVVKDGLTAHMVNGIMNKRQYFLDQISLNNEPVKALWIVRSKNVIKQYGKGFKNESVRDAIDKEVLSTGKTISKITEDTHNIFLRMTIPYKATVTNNGAKCLSCHDVNAGDTLGAVSMKFDMTNIRSDGLFTMLKIIGLNLLFIIVVLYLINKYITPYMNLFSNMQIGIKKAYSGDFTHEFETSVQGDGKQIALEMNELFKKMQSTFGDIKFNLATFIPQGLQDTKDPLQEAKNIIKELSDIYKFKKTIELDTSKDTVYGRIVDVLTQKYELENFSFYEIDIHSDTRKLIYISQGTSICHDYVDDKASLCRAHRTKTDVISTEFVDVCQECVANDLNYVCLPFSINDDNALVISITTKNISEVNTINQILPSIKNYLEAAKPVIESRILMAKLRDTSLRDGMTKLYNRRFLEEFIDTVMKQVSRTNETYSIMMLDIDFFKMVNDTYGHDVGDRVIVALAKIFHETIRESDLAIRYGGEEFVIMLHNADENGAQMVAQKIHDAFGALKFTVEGGQVMQKTISIGIAKFPTDGDTVWKTIKFADTALYVAKTTGRDKIVQYTSEMSENDGLR